MPEETALDAMNAALGEQLAPSGEEAPAPEGNTDADAPVEGDSEGTVSPEGEETPAPEGEETPEGDPAAEKGPNGERERNPDGTWKKAEPKKEPEVKAEEKPVVDPKKPEPKAKDPINDPIPENLKKDTSDRIRSLIETAKTVTAERDQVKQDFDYLIKGVEATGTTPQQYGETLSWLKLFNSNDPAQQEKALELVETVAERLSTLLGKERTVGDPLSAHADLKDAVTKGQITAQYAKEIARTRNGQQFRTELSTQATAQEQTRVQQEQELNTARSDLTELEKTLQASDPSYAAKKAILVPALKPLFASIPPSQWKQKFLESYRSIQVGTPAPAAPKVPVNQPLRAKQPAGGQTKAPSSALEAMNSALSSIGGK